MSTQHITGSYQRATHASANLALWTLAWVATLALARFGPDAIWDSREAVSWFAIGLNVAVGIGWILAHMHFLRDIDELQRKIMQDALGITLGIAFVIGFAYVAIKSADLVGFDASIGTLPALMGGVYILAIAIGHLRYR